MVVLPSSPVWYQSRGIDTSHNGILAFGSRNLVYLLDLTQKRPKIFGILGGHADKVTSCSFCPPMSQDQLLRLVSGADDCTVKVWDVRQKLMLSEHSAHSSNKIISVHWSPVNPSLILSGDEKGCVICWDLEKGSTDRFFPDGNSQMNLCCLTCSPHDESIVAIGYKSGAVSVMDIKRNGMVVKKLRGHTNEVHGIVWVPHKDENFILSNNKQLLDETGSDEVKKFEYEGVLVTGSKDKTIKLWSISKARCIKTVRIPNRVNKGRKANEDIARLYTTVHWPAGSRTRFISSGYNGDLIMWDIDPDAEQLFEILASQSHDAGHQRIVFNVSCGSDTGNTIVSTSMDRQVLHWTIPNCSVKNCTEPDWLLPTLGGFVYSIAVSPNDPRVVAIGVGDGMIRIWKTRSPKSAYDIVTLWQDIKEKVMALAWHPTKEGCLSFATEDGKVGIYDVLSMRPPILAATYHLKPVYALSWGPKCIPKPTDGGNSAHVSTKNLNLYSSGGDGIIYQHDVTNMSNDAVDIDSIIESSSTSSSHRGKHSEVSWSQDNRLLAIGNDDGAISIFTSPYLCHVVEIKCHSKIVNCVCWRPAEDESDDHLEIATGSNNSTVFIHDLRKLFADRGYTVGEDLDQPITTSKPSKSLVGHLSRITGISYNTRNPCEIVSSSYDSTAQVWNTETEKPLFNFRGHHGRLMCVVWTSVIDEADPHKKSGIIYTGADDYTVHGWYAEDQQHTEPVKSLPDFVFGPKNKFQSKKKGRQKKNAQSLQQCLPNGDGTTTTSDMVADSKGRLTPDMELLLEKKKTELLASISGDPTSNGNDKSDNTLLRKPSMLAADLAERPGFANAPRLISISQSSPTKEIHPKLMPAGDEIVKRKKRLKNMFPQSVTMDNRKKASQHQDCLKIVQWNTRDAANVDNDDDKLSFLPGEPKHINLGFYTDRKAAFRMMKNEAAKLEEEEISEGPSNIRLWMGDVVGAITDATEKSQLTDQLVALAPIAGQGFWRKTAHAFAKQLMAEEHFTHAVQYLLICDKVHEAIQVLLDSRNYREAVALARARLCDDDPFLRKTVTVWGRKLKSGGSAELAAKCFASIGEYEVAAEALSQRATSGASNITDSDISSLWAAASVAIAAGKTDLAYGFADRALGTTCVRSWDWQENTDILESFPNLKCYKFVSTVHEALATRLVMVAGLGAPATMRKSEWNSASLHSEGCSFLNVLSSAWKTQSGSGDASPLQLDLETRTQLHKDALQHHNDDVAESRILLLLSYSLAGAICTRTPTHLKDKNSTTCSSERSLPPICESSYFSAEDCVRHLSRSVDIVSKVAGIDEKLWREIHVVIHEVIKWIWPVIPPASRLDGSEIAVEAEGRSAINVGVTQLLSSSEHSNLEMLALIRSQLSEHGHRDASE